LYQRIEQNISLDQGFSPNPQACLSEKEYNKISIILGATLIITICRKKLPKIGREIKFTKTTYSIQLE